MAKVCYHGRGNNRLRIDRKKNAQVMKRRRSVKAKIKATTTSSLHLDDKTDQVQAFMAEPVSFKLGDADYGNKLFLNLRKELLMANCLYCVWGKPRIRRTIKGFKYSDEDIYTFSSLEHLIHSF